MPIYPSSNAVSSYRNFVPLAWQLIFVLELSELQAERDAVVVPREEEIREYYELRKVIDGYTRDAQDVINHPTYCLPFMQPGRLVRIKYNGMDFDWAIVLGFKTVQQYRGKDTTTAETDDYILDVLLQCASDSDISKDATGQIVGLNPVKDGDPGQLIVSLKRFMQPIVCNTHNVMFLDAPHQAQHDQRYQPYPRQPPSRHQIRGEKGTPPESQECQGAIWRQYSSLGSDQEHGYQGPGFPGLNQGEHTYTHTCPHAHIHYGMR